MHYCKYHPLTSATYHCNTCKVHCCDTCVDEGEKPHNENRCFVCRKEMDFLGAVNSVDPFWRRLQESFRYPLKTGSLILIGAVSFFTTALSFMPLGFLWYLILEGVLLKYCFRCLENTSDGEMTAPSITTAYEGGLSLILQLILMIVILAGSVFAVNEWLGTTAAGVVGFFYVVGLPAMLINFALSGSLIEALNPLKALQLMTSVGLPYGLLLAFLMIMMGSVGVFSEILTTKYTFLSTVAQSIISNYYMVVMFHLMGYMIFQYQGKLGYVASEVKEDIDVRREPHKRLAANIDVMLKEGDFHQALKLYETAITQFPNEKEFIIKYFDFLVAVKGKVYLERFGDYYLDYLVGCNRQDKLNLAYKQILSICPAYIPKLVNLRFNLALACWKIGDAKSVVRLINGMHREFPQFENLAAAYNLLAEALSTLPNMNEQAEMCRKMSRKFKGTRKIPLNDKLGESKVAKVTTFSSSELSAREIVTAVDTTGVSNPISSEEKQANKPKELPPIEFV